ncbi:MAG: FliM/FliN family flagellar motor switch protein [Candidatus Ruminococcus intestinipullorum]|nr:FliM/FliN family flagellar motor switch protein [Candidatus Ruminococcus intestinipullorum]
MFKVREVVFPEFKTTQASGFVQEIDESRERMLEIPMEVAVEIGSVECTVSEILNLEVGRVLMLDKQAGSPADVMVNGELIAKGDVMVMGEQFATRITEIANKRG